MHNQFIVKNQKVKQGKYEQAKKADKKCVNYNINGIFSSNLNLGYLLVAIKILTTF